MQWLNYFLLQRCICYLFDLYSTKKQLLKMLLLKKEWKFTKEDEKEKYKTVIMIQN